MSFVLMSPSTVMRLKLCSTATESARCSSFFSTGASVVRTQSIVAMFGSIMPAPFAMPPERVGAAVGGRHAHGELLGESVRGHDGAGRGLAVAGSERRGRLRHAFLDPLDGERHADAPGRADEHLPLAQTKAPAHGA